MVDAHKRFENEVQSHEPEVNQVRNLFESIPQKTPKDQEKLDKVGSTFHHIFLKLLKLVLTRYL